MDIFTLSLLRRWVCAEVSCFYLSDNVEKSAVVCQWVKNSHVQLPFVDFELRYNEVHCHSLKLYPFLSSKINV